PNNFLVRFNCYLAGSRSVIAQWPHVPFHVDDAPVIGRQFNFRYSWHKRVWAVTASNLSNAICSVEQRDFNKPFLGGWPILGCSEFGVYAVTRAYNSPPEGGTPQPSLVFRSLDNATSDARARIAGRLSL